MGSCCLLFSRGLLFFCEDIVFLEYWQYDRISSKIIGSTCKVIKKLRWMVEMQPFHGL